MIAYYVDDMLATINVEHRYVLRLIDDNSPRISAAEDTNETAAAAAAAPGAAGAVPTLRAHNLGAVKFIDSDGPTHTRIHCHWRRQGDPGGPGPPMAGQKNFFS